MDDLIGRLSEIRSNYNCFDEAEAPYYRALSEAIKNLSERKASNHLQDLPTSPLLVRKMPKMPYAETRPISEEYAKAVRTWLVQYQVKCAELQGRYTPYEVLGWIVSDWRKENEIW